MRKTLTFLAATTAITAGIGLPAWSAMRAETQADSLSAPFGAGIGDARLIRVSGDDDDDDEYAVRSRNDDDEEDDDDCEEEEEDGTAACAELVNPAPAGTTAPPQNGLFGDGPPPQVQMK